MKLSPTSTILMLVRQYPFLIDALATHNSAFEKLKNPILRQTLGRVATLEKAASMGKEDTLDLMLFIAGCIMSATGENLEIVPPTVQQPVAAKELLSDEQRMEALKEIILALHEGADLESLKKKFEQTVGDISPSEIAALEQALVKDGLAESEIKKMCNLHVELFQGALAKQEAPSTPAGHPVHTYIEENREATTLTKSLLTELDRMGPEPDANIWAFTLNQINTLLKDMEPILIHYVRKENQLFPMLERHCIEAPPKVMWEIHDDIRDKFRGASELLRGPDRTATSIALRELAVAIDDMIVKEEQILLPMALETLNNQDWARARKGDDQIGYAFAVIPGKEWYPEDIIAPEIQSESGLINLSTGSLPLEIVNKMLCNLPVDMSFVDPDDKVAYYSDSPHRLFPRSPEVIGRDVKNCHPQDSVHMVTEILDKFRSGERDKAEFWLELGGKFIHIQYIALRSEDGKYLGCLEIGQDATYLRSLEGQRRLLEWK